MHTRFIAANILENLGLGSLLALGACVLTGADDETTDSAASVGTDADSSAGAESAGSGDDGSSDGAGVDSSSAAGSDDGGSSESGDAPPTPFELVDCDADGSSDLPQCQRYPDAGTIGAGLPIYDNDYAEVWAGYLDGQTLVVAVDLMSNTDEFGGVLSIDLPTGDRTWIAGNYKYTNDGEVTMRGGGEEIGAIRGLARLSDGRVVLHRSDDGDSEDAFLWLDTTTGDRSVLVAAASGRFTCGVLEVLLSEPATLAPGPDGDFWIAGRVDPSDSGVLHFAPDGQCEFTSRSGTPDGTDVGTGAPFGDMVDGLEYHDGRLYGLTGFGDRELFVIDPATGDRTLLSSSKGGIGIGPELGSHSLDVTDTKIWTSGYFGDVLPMVSVDALTGDRSDEAASPLAGPVGAAVDDDRPQIFVYGEQVVFETNHGGIGVYDPSTKNSNWISM